MAGHVVGTMSAPPLPSALGQFPEAGVGATFASSNLRLQKSLRSLVNGVEGTPPWLQLGEVLGRAQTHRNQLGAAQTGLVRPLSHLAKMQEGEAEKESPGMLPAAVTAEAPTACGVGDTPAPSGHFRDSSGYFRPAGTFLIHCTPRPLNYFLLSASAERYKNHSGVTFSLY